MPQFRRSYGFSCWRVAVLAAFTSLASPAVAAVTQPDGTVMPLPSPSDEVGLQELFDAKEGVGVLDAKADAATEPSTFKPLCGFTAQLILRETGTKTQQVGWYNSPVADVPPTTICDETTGMSSGGGACTQSDIFILVGPNEVNPPFGRASDPLSNPGKIVTGADIVASPYYAGGQIGFVLLGSEGHFSEQRLNTKCVGATCTNGDHWIPTIMYASKTIPRGYYMCSEDQVVGPTTWGGNDGDFNDYVFLFTGLVCSGSGEPCDTGKPGICAAGLTDCQNAAGESECRPARTPGEESCNGLDDDCNGETDEGDLCPEGEKCVMSRCVPLCGTAEFRCDADHECVEGACVEKSCVDVKCDPGEVCMGGKCVGSCDDVTCPTGQTCADGVCVDPCEGIDCGEGFVCEGGACLVECSCAGCAKGECDKTSGHCVDSGCGSVTCDSGQHCAKGKCVDDCDAAKCPGGAACEAGQCLPPATGQPDGGAPSTGGTDPGISFGGEDTGTGNVGNVSSGGSSDSGSSNGGSGGSDGSGDDASDDGCGCRVAGTGSNSGAALLAAAAALVLASRRRRGR